MNGLSFLIKAGIHRKEIRCRAPSEFYLLLALHPVFSLGQAAPNPVDLDDFQPLALIQSGS